MIQCSSPPRYDLILTEGYVPSSRRRVRDDPSHSIEALLAESLYRVLKDPAIPARDSGSDGAGIDLVHAWVVGQPGWIEHAPDPFASMAPGEKDPSYRVFILGFSPIPEELIFLGNVVRCLESAGVRKKADTLDPSLTGPAVTSLLQIMKSAYTKTGQAPSIILEAIGVPYAFRGD